MPTPQRLPIVNSDDGTWGDIIRQYIAKEHYNDDTDNTANGGHQKITIRPGTAAAGTAPLKFASGTLLTTPEAGAIEFNGDTLYFTQTTGPVRKKLAAYDDSTGATGDLYYRASNGSFTRLAAGSAGDFLTIASGIPTWTSTIVGAAIDNTSTVTLKDTNFTLQDDADTTKQMKFQLSGVATGTTRTLTVPDADTTIAGTDAAQTLTNKRINPRILTLSSTATPAVNTDLYDIVYVNALAVNITGFTMSGTPVDGQTLRIAITTTGAARNVTFGTSFEASGYQAVPTSVGANIRQDFEFVWNAATSKWRFNDILNYASIATVSNTQTLANKTLTAPRIANAGFIADSNGNEQIVFNATTSAVNEIAVTNAATGGAPRIAAQGSDTNVNLDLYGKGTGVVRANGVQVATIADIANKADVDVLGTTDVLKGTALNLNPESANFNFLPGYFNDLAFNNLRGGTTTVTKNGSPFTFSGGDNWFKPGSAFVSASTGLATSDVFVITVTTTENITWNGFYGIVFPHSWNARDVTIEVFFGGSWTQIYSVTNSTDYLHLVRYTANSGAAVTQLRYTLTNLLTTNGIRISSLFAVDFDSTGMAAGFMTREGGALYGTNAAPPTLTAAGGDANIDLNLVPKGTGRVEANGVAIPTISSADTLTNKTLTAPVINGTVSGTGVSSAPTASTLVLRDTNGNVSANAFVHGFTTTATVAGTTVLSITSDSIQEFTGTSTQTVRLPTTSVVAGARYTVINSSTGGAVTVQSSGANTISVLPSGTSATFTALVATPTTAANWESTYINTGDTSSNTTTSVDGEVALFSGTGGKTIKRATGSGIAKLSSGVLGTAIAGTDYVTPTGSETLANKTLTTPTIASFTNATHDHTSAAGGGQLNATTALDATGTKSSSTFLRGDNTWATPPNTTYSEIPSAEITTGTATTGRLISGRRAQEIVDKAVAASGDVTLNGVQTLTNKTISGSNNTITNLSATSVTTGAFPMARIGIGDFENIASGSDFETEFYPWSLGTGRSIASDFAHTGTYSYKFTAGAGNATYTGGTIELKEGEQLYCECWVRRDADFNATDARIRLGAMPGNGNVANLSFHAAVFPEVDTWVKKSFITNPYPAGNIGVNPSIVMTGLTAGNLWIDDIVIRRVKPTETIPNLDASKITAGTLPVARGGTGATTLTGIVKGNGTGAFTAAAAGTDYVTPSGAETLANKTLTTPTIASFVNSSHNHTNAAGGGQLTATTALNATGTPSSSTYLRGDNTWTTITAGDASTNTTTSVDGELALFSGTTGKQLKRATGSGIATLSSGVLSTTATTGSGNVVLATSPTITTPVINGIPSGTGVSVSPTANTLALRDSSSNLSASLLLLGFTSTVTSATTVTLTLISNQLQIFTGSSNQTVVLPTTSVVAGTQFRIVNNSTGVITVNASGGTTVITLAPNTSSLVTALQAAPTTNAHWEYQYWASNVASGKTLTVTQSMTLAGTDGTTMTFPNASGTVMTTAAAQAVTNKDLTSATNTFPTFNQNTTGSAGSLATARTIGLSGAATGTATSFDGSANITIPVTALNASNLSAGTLPDARMSGTYTGFTHKIDGANTVFTTPNSGSTSNLARTVYGLAEYRSNSGTQTGAIIFYAPNTTSSIMHQLEISGMLYNQNIVQITVQGYRTTGAWSDTRKVSTGTVDLQVRWGVDASGKNCLILGDVGTSWSYPHLSIVRAMFSHTGTADAYVTGWTVGVVTDLTGFTQITSDIANSAVAGNISGNATTATTLQTARTIGGVSFNGSANINLPGVNTVGNQNTTGSAATLTTARTIQTNLASTSSQSFNGSANITPGVTGTLPVGNGGTGATTLTGLVKGNGSSAFTAATAGTDYVTPTGSEALTNKTITGATNTISVADANFTIIDDVDNTKSVKFSVGGVSAGATLTLNVPNVTSGTHTLLSRNSSDVVTNKRIQPRTLVITSSATPSVDTDEYDFVSITALATNVTSMTANLVGAPEDGEKIMFRIKDNGTPRSITWGASFRASGVAAPLTATSAGREHHVLFVYSATVSKWVCLAVDSVGY